MTKSTTNDLRELMKTEMFATIEYGRLNPDMTQDALEATWITHLDDIMEYITEELSTYKQNLVREVEGLKKEHLLEARIDTDLEHGTHIGETNGFNDCREQFTKNYKEKMG